MAEGRSLFENMKFIRILITILVYFIVIIGKYLLFLVMRLNLDLSGATYGTEASNAENNISLALLNFNFFLFIID